MRNKVKWIRVIYFIGILALIIGTIDPLEGSILIAIGCTIIALSCYLNKDKDWKKFFLSSISIAIGVFSLFYFSSLGGFGGNSERSWWWGILILPYPFGWLLAVSSLIIRAVKNRKRTSEIKQ